MWIEAITVRTARPEQGTALLKEMKALRQEQAMPELKWSACYQSLIVENEISVHLAWTEDSCPPGKTQCGLLIARRFAEHGLVHHTLWKLSHFLL
jgi:hypothetical protein